MSVDQVSYSVSDKCRTLTGSAAPWCIADGCRSAMFMEMSPSYIPMCVQMNLHGVVKAVWTVEYAGCCQRRCHYRWCSAT